MRKRKINQLCITGDTIKLIVSLKDNDVDNDSDSDDDLSRALTRAIK